MGKDPLLFDLINEDNFDAFKDAVNKRNINCRSPKNKFTPFLFSVYLGKIKFVEFLYQKKADHSLSGIHGMKAVHYAALRDSVEVLKFLKNNGFDFSETCDDGLTVLHIAARESSVECIQYLIKQCPELINSQTKDGFTPLHFSVFNNDQDTVSLLLENGADANIKSHKPFLSSLELAKKLGNNSIVDLMEKLKSHKPSFSPLEIAKNLGNNSKYFDEQYAFLLLVLFLGIVLRIIFLT